MTAKISYSKPGWYPSKKPFLQTWWLSWYCLCLGKIYEKVASTQDYRCYWNIVWSLWQHFGYCRIVSKKRQKIWLLISVSVSFRKTVRSKQYFEVRRWLLHGLPCAFARMNDIPNSGLESSNECMNDNQCTKFDPHQLQKMTRSGCW